MTVIQIITVILFALYLPAAAYALIAPTRQPDPQRGVGQGCVGLLVLGLLILAGLLALAVHLQVHWLANVLFIVAVFPLISLIGGGLTHLLQRRRAQKMIDSDDERNRAA